MLLSTGNKSEYAVGYATIYGDMCGGYAPMKDLLQALEVYALARWRNRAAEGGAEGRKRTMIPQAVIERAPSAELRDNQTDQDSLPPYEVLDAILERYIDSEQSQAEIIAADSTRRPSPRGAAGSRQRIQTPPVGTGTEDLRRAFGRERRYPITSGWR